MADQNADPAADLQRVEIRVDWSAADAMPSVYANQVLTQVTPDEAILVFGQVLPPAAPGGAEEMRERLQGMDAIRVQPVAKVVVSPAKLVELIEVLGATAAKLEQAKSLRDATASDTDQTEDSP